MNEPKKRCDTHPNSTIGTPRPWHLGHHAANPYFTFTDACNDNRVRIILASGQACVWHRLALASKDGDWIIRASEESLLTVLERLEALGARYRLGAPLDLRWLRAGWSSHFEATSPQGIRLRFDFVTHPPRISSQDLDSLWNKIDTGVPAVLSPEELIPLKQTMRLKDYPFIGALALRLSDPRDQIHWSIDATTILNLLEQNPDLASHLELLRPSLVGIPRTVASFETAIDAEIRTLRHHDERRMELYTKARQPWAERFRSLDIEHLPLRQAHHILVTNALGLLPETVPCPI